MKQRSVEFSEDHEIYRTMVKRFVDDTLLPGNLQWEKDGCVPREVWEAAGELGLLCPSVPEELGGSGADFLFDVVLIEEMARAGVAGPLGGFIVHSNVVTPYIVAFGSSEQKKTWIPKMIHGKAIGALGLSEPDTGSDLRAMKTRARRDGDDYVISGQKTYISNGQNCDLIVLAAKLDDTPADSVTLFLVEADRAGFTRGNNMDKIGLKSQDTSELFFDEVRIPRANLIGEEGRGMHYMSAKLAEERLAQAIRSIVVAEAAIDWTVEYTSERKAFGKPIADFQNTQFVLADLKAEATVVRAYIDNCINAHMDANDKLTITDAAIGKLRATELHCRATDQCLQLHGGFGYIWETPIARAFADGRVAKIAAGSVEIMKVIISRSMFQNLSKK